MHYDYEEMKVWQKAHAVTLEVYRATRAWPKEETYALTSQVRRAAVSVEANIAEGCGRTGKAEFSHFASMSAGSASELRCELRIAYDLGYLEEKQYVSLRMQLIEVSRMLASLIRTLTANGSRPTAGAQR